MNRIVKTGVYTRNGEENKFNFYTSLTAQNKLKFVNSVMSLLIGDNYNCVIRDLIFDYAIIDIFTDVDTSDIVDIVSMENILNETNIAEIVKANVDFGVIEELNSAINDNIEYRTGIHKNPVYESLSHLLDTIDNKLSNIDTEKMMEMAQIISGMSGEFTVDKMIEAYSKSDLFKQNYANVMAEKNQCNDDVDVVTTKNVKNNKRAASAK